MNYDEEFLNLQLDKPGRGKTVQQILRHTLSDQLENKPIDRSLFILSSNKNVVEMESEHSDRSTKSSIDEEYLILQDLYMKGDDIQKLSVIQALPQLLQTDRHETLSKIIPKIQQELPNSSCEFHLATSQIFRILIERQLPINIMSAVLIGIESKDPIIANTWLETLLACISKLSEDTIKSEVLPLAMSKSQPMYGVNFRVASCRMLGLISVHPRLTSFEVKKDILPLVLNLCQDYSYEVRAAMCAQLPNVAQGMGNDNAVKTRLLPSFVELSSDENMFVRATAVDTVVLIIPFLNAETITDTIIPLVKFLCTKSTDTGDSTFATIAKIYGKLLDNLQGKLEHKDCLWFLNFFKDLSKRGAPTLINQFDFVDPVLSVTCRQFCAFNLPAVTFFTVTQLPMQLDIWYTIFKTLVHDSCYMVRKTVAGCIHEITRILGPNNNIIKIDIVKLLRDDAEDVLETLVPNIATTLELLSASVVLPRDSVVQFTLEIGRAIIKCQVELFKGHNWRLKTIFLTQLECLPNCMPSDFIHQHFAPVVFNLVVEASTKPVKSQAARTMLIFLRYNVKETHRRWIRDSLINQLCYSRSCYTRHIYIKMAVHAMEIFSNRYFKKHFFRPLLTLIDDPVSTVRICVVKLIPMLRQMITMPSEKELDALLVTTMYRLELTEKDKDVMEVLIHNKDIISHAICHEVLLEEKRKIEEEDQVHLGKMVLRGKQVLNTGNSSQSNPGKESIQNFKSIKIKTNSNTTRTPNPISITNDMSFLEQHFYIDAGITLPENISASRDNVDNVTEELKTLTVKVNDNQDDDLVISTVSVENTNIESLSDTDLQQLQTFTTNITDDVKVNLQKINSKGLSKLRPPKDSHNPMEGVKKRNKRYSSVLTADCIQINSTSSSNILKRRSLNIAASDLSKIPVCFKTPKKGLAKCENKSSKDEPTNMLKGKSKSVMNIKIDSSDSKIGSANQSKSLINGRLGNKVETNLVSEPNEENEGNFNSNKPVKVSHKELKENVPIIDSIKNNVPIKVAKENAAKVSSLPVLIRRPQSGVKK